MPRLEVAADGFRFDDRPLRIISGGLHYFRIHLEQWADRLRKARLMGLNTIETYVPWNVHSPHPGEFRLDAGLGLPRLLDLAAAEDLHVPLRPGPYIGAEWEGGGLPSWLLVDEDIEPRSRDPRCLKAVDDYLAALLPPVLPYLSTRGGPILAVQLEKEYGAYGDDSGYLEELAELLRSAGSRRTPPPPPLPDSSSDPTATVERVHGWLMLHRSLGPRQRIPAHPLRGK